MNEDIAYQAVGSLYALTAALLRGDEEGFAVLAAACDTPLDVLDAATVAVAQASLEIARRGDSTPESVLSGGGSLGELPEPLRLAALGAVRRLGDGEIRSLRSGLEGDPVVVAAQAVAAAWLERWGPSARERSQELCLAIAVGRESRSSR